jgi:GntR family transcriptional repressor for pyruvate dehydrogenase complex
MEPDDAVPMDRPLRRVSIVDQLVEKMTRKVIAGAWPTGAKIPSLRTLASSHSVSPLTIREAIRVMQTRGLLETRHGVGTFVVAEKESEDFVPWMLGSIDIDDYDDLIEARDVIEGQIIRLAASRRTDDDLDRLRGIVIQMRRHRLEPEKYLEVDTNFHIALAETSHNPVLLRGMLAIRGPLRRLMEERNRRYLVALGSLDVSIESHAEIVEAIARREPEFGEAVLHEISRRSHSQLGKGAH